MSNELGGQDRRAEGDGGGRPAERKLEFDDLGNVVGVVFTDRVDHFVEFVDEAIIHPAVLSELGKLP